MNKKLISVAIAAAVAAPAAMANNVTIYGKVRQSVDIVDFGNSTVGTVDTVEINDKTSRLGFKGSEDLGNGLKAIWKMEGSWRISGGGNNASAGNNNSNEFGSTGNFRANRNAYVGLAGDFGTVLIGRHDHPLKMSTGKLDLFGDTVGDNNNPYTEELIDFRANGTIAYVSPNFNGITAAVALVPGENLQADGIADAFSVSVVYDANGFFASAAYEEGDEDIDYLGGNSTTGLTACATDCGDYDQWRIGLGYTANNFHVNAVYAESEVESQTSGMSSYVDRESLVVSGSYTFGNNKVLAKYFDVDENATDRDGFAIGFRHMFSKRTDVGVYYVDSDDDAAATDGDVFSLQMNHNF